MPVAAPKQGPSAKLITCILPAGDGLKLANDLYGLYALTGTNVTPGRGASQRSSTIADEIDILTVIVSANEADKVFAYIYNAIGIETTPHRFMFQTALISATDYQLPELPSPEIQ